MIKKGDTTIRIVPDKEIYQNEMREILKNIEEGKKVKVTNKKVVVFTPKTFSKVFSPERLRLIHTVQTSKINSISHLAEILNRKFEAVDRDIKYLESLNLVRLVKKDRVKIPLVAKKLHFII